MGALANITTELIWLHSLLGDMGIPFLIVFELLWSSKWCLQWTEKSYWDL